MGLEHAIDYALVAVFGLHDLTAFQVPEDAIILE